eukprot:55998-Eustigmatos_ZCMA.PRE.1
MCKKCLVRKVNKLRRHGATIRKLVGRIRSSVVVRRGRIRAIRLPVSLMTKRRFAADSWVTKIFEYDFMLRLEAELFIKGPFPGENDAMYLRRADRCKQDNTNKAMLYTIAAHYLMIDRKVSYSEASQVAKVIHKQVFTQLGTSLCGYLQQPEDEEEKSRPAKPMHTYYRRPKDLAEMSFDTYEEFKSFMDDDKISRFEDVEGLRRHCSQFADKREEIYKLYRKVFLRYNRKSWPLDLVMDMVEMIDEEYYDLSPRKWSLDDIAQPEVIMAIKGK